MVFEALLVFEYTLRHSMTSNMLKNEEPLPVIASVLGCANTAGLQFNSSRYAFCCFIHAELVFS
jgi:hypothetical protein